MCDISEFPLLQEVQGSSSRYRRECKCYCSRKWSDEWYCCECDDAVCFPGNALVTLTSGHIRTMSQIKTGDLVLTGMWFNLYCHS